MQQYVYFGEKEELYFGGNANHVVHVADIQSSARVMWDVVQASRLSVARQPDQHLAAATAAANALIILNAAGVQFSGCNFSQTTLGPPHLPRPEPSLGTFLVEYLLAAI